MHILMSYNSRRLQGSLPFGKLRVRDFRSCLHTLRPQAARLADDAGEDVRDALLVEGTGILFHHAGQHLALTIAVVRQQARGNLDRGNLTGDGGALVEQAKQLGIERVNLATPVVERFVAVNCLVSKNRDPLGIAACGDL